MKNTVRGLLVFLSILASFGQTIACADSILYSTDAGTQQLYTLSRADAATLIGSFGVPGVMAGLAYDGGHDILYGSTTSTNNPSTRS